MSPTKEEAIALAKKCGALHIPDTGEVSFPEEPYFYAYTSAIEQKVEQKHIEYENHLRTKLAEQEQRHLQDRAKEQKYQAQIAMLRDALVLSEGHRVLGHIDVKVPEVTAALSATQATAEAWEREVKTRAVPDGYVAVPISKLTHEDCYRFGLDAAELRNQQEGKEK